MSTRLVSDWVHSACFADGDALRYQQGVQVIETGGSRPVLSLVAGPACDSRLWKIEGSERIVAPHGKASVPLGDVAIRERRSGVMIDGPVGGCDLDEAAVTQGQADLAFFDMVSTQGVVPVSRLEPLLCLRGTGVID